MTDPTNHVHPSVRPTGVSPTLLEVCGVFTRYANLTIGGGSATIAVLRGQIIRRRGWISEGQFHLAYALSRLTPGTNVLAFCTAVGWMARRWSGALVALTAASVPCSALAVAATYFYELWQHDETFVAALRGALAAAVSVMINTAWILARPYVKASMPKAIVMVLTSIALVSLLSFSPFQVLLLSAVVGVAWPARENTE